MKGAAPILVTFLLAGTALAAQEVLLRDKRPFRSSVDLTSVNVTVLDTNGALVTGLGRDDFEVYEDGVPQVVSQFVGGRVPVSLGLLLDTSDSMFGPRLEEARGAIDRFLFELLDRQDEFFILAFNHAPHLLTEWTANPFEVRRALDAIKPSGATAAYDAVVAGLPLVARRNRQRAALVIVSDGADTASDASPRDVRNALLRSDAFIYAIAIDARPQRAINARVNPQTLREITDQSGGRTEVVQSTAELESAAARIADELSHQYLLGYTSSHGTDGKFHSIRVRVKDRDYKIRARSGYIAPTDPVGPARRPSAEGASEPSGR
ncbi:MAG: VWA domain-containing protein [Acidimicrobiia bacterium]|nr:VWA domain-containing protein [Acidimicrobiia bacterium]